MNAIDRLIMQLNALALTLITDRDSDDIEELQSLLNKRFQDLTTAEKNKLINPHKGAYGPSDMNRVGAFCNKFVQLMGLLGYETPGTSSLYPMEIGWSAYKDPSTEMLQNYMQQITLFKNKWDYASVTIQNDISNGISLETANNIEYMLYYSLAVIEEMLACNRYCDQLWCGQDIQWIGGLII